MSKLEKLFTTLTGSDFIWSASLKTNLPLSLFSGFVIPYYSSQPAAGISINFMALPCFRQLVACLSLRRSGSHPRLGHVGILLDNLTLRVDDSEQFVSPISLIPIISQIKVASIYPQTHTLFSLLLNKTILPFSVQKL